MKLIILMTLSLSFAAFAKENLATDKNAVAPSADFIELTEAYHNRPKIAPKDNAFIYLVGLTAPEGTDPMTFGQQVIDWSNQKVANGGKSDTPEPEIPYGIGDDFKELRRIINCNIRAETPCALAKHQMLARDVVENKAMLLNRYQTLLTFPNYQNILTIDSTSILPTSFVNDANLQRLALMDLWLNRNDYPPEKIKQALQKDYDFRLKKSANANTLVEKMIANAGLKNNYYWLNEILKSVNSDTANKLTPRYLHEPIPSSTLSMRTAYIGELQFFMSLLKPQNADEEFNPIVSQLSDNEKQRLLNTNATLQKTLINISESADYQTQLKQLETNPSVQQYIALMTALDKDSGGKLSEFTFGDTPFEQFVMPLPIYIERSYHLVATLKAVNVLQKIRQQSMKPADIPAFLQHAEQHNPLTGKPFEWNGDTQQIVIPTEKSFTYYLSL